MSFIHRMRGAFAATKFYIWTSLLTKDVATSPTLTAGAGVPTASEPKGSIYLRTGGAGSGGIFFVATDSVGTWESLATAINGYGAGISIPDDTADAYQVSEGSNDYINVDTQDGTETFTIGNPNTNPLVSLPGSGGLAVSGEIRNDRLCYAVLAASGGGGGSTDATLDIDIQNAAGQNVGSVKAVRVRFYDATRNVLTGTASTLGFAATTGTIVATDAADNWVECLTDATGNLTLTVTNSADDSIYATAESSGNAVAAGQGCVIVQSVEEAIAWAA